MTNAINRRTFLKLTGAGTLSLVIGCDDSGNVTKVTDAAAAGADAGATGGADAGAATAAPVTTTKLSTWVRVASDNTVYIAMHKAEMGQGVHTTLPLIVAEEMDLDADQIKVDLVAESAPYSLGTGLPMTYGSTSVALAYTPLRKVGASARAVLRQAAANVWKISIDDVTTQSGKCLAPDGRSLKYGELVAEARKLKLPTNPTLKKPSEHKLLGKDQVRFIDAEIVAGTAVYGIDSARPDGLYAAIRHAPTPKGVPTNVDSLSSDDPSVKAIVALPNAVAVVAESFWTATKVVNKLPVQFKTSKTDESFSTATMRKALQEGLTDDGYEVKATGDVKKVLAASSKKIVADYYVPPIAHFPLEPVNATAHVTDNSCELWLPTQAPSMVVSTAAKLTGLGAKQITLHPTLIGGGFGRKSNQDYTEAAIRVAQAVKAPVTLIWSREQDVKRDKFRPSFSGRLTGAVDDDGKIAAWDLANCGDSVLGFGQGDPMSVQGLNGLPYSIANQRVRHMYRKAPVTSGFWRSIGHSQNTFFVESFVDELAHLAGKDPLDFRLQMLDDHPRIKAVLQRAAKLGNWGKPTVAGAGQGLAVCDGYGSMMAVVCEASVDTKTGTVKVHSYSAAVDCGVVMQPGGVRAQIEGGLIFGLSAALHEEITFEKGQTVESNFSDYEVLQPSEAPKITVDIIASDKAPGGVGELSVGPAGPALANAIFAAAAVRCRELPLRKSLTKALNV